MNEHQKQLEKDLAVQALYHYFKGHCATRTVAAEQVVGESVPIISPNTTFKDIRIAEFAMRNRVYLHMEDPEIIERATEEYKQSKGEL